MGLRIWRADAGWQFGARKGEGVGHAVVLGQSRLMDLKATGITQFVQLIKEVSLKVFFAIVRRIEVPQP